MNTHHPSIEADDPSSHNASAQSPVRRSASDEGGKIENHLSAKASAAEENSKIPDPQPPVRRSASDEGGKIKNHLSAKASAAEENSKIPDPQPPVRRSASDEGGSTLNHQLLYFSDPNILHGVDRGHLTRFLEG